jgi:hypothetical protein
MPAIIIEIISFLAASTLFFQVSAPSYLRLFSVFLFLTIIIEFSSGTIFTSYDAQTKLYNLFTTFEFEFYLMVIRFMIQSRRVKRIILYVLFIYPILVLLNLLFIQKDTFHTITYSLGCLLIVPTAIYYFYEIFRLPTFVVLVREPAFWICTALLFYYCCSFMLTGFWNQLHVLPDVVMNNVNKIFAILNFLLYSLFSIAFLCRIKFRKQ